MKQVEGDVKRQLRLLYTGSSVAALINFLITLILWLPILPVFYAFSALLFCFFSQTATLDRFLPIFAASFFTVVLQSIFTVYVLGDDCGIQLYLLALLIPSYYIRMTRHSPAFQRWFIVAVCGACIVFYLISDEIIDYFMTPLTHIDNLSELIFTFINVLGSLSLLVFVGNIFVQGYQRSLRDLLRSNDELENEVERDALTGLKNRRGIEPLLTRAYQAWMDRGTPLTVALGDIDFFKQINDSYGHDAGDLVLRRLGTLLSCRVEAPVQVCRWGGEEFLFVLPLPAEQAFRRLEELRQDIEQLSLTFQEQPLHVTMTMGLACADQVGTLSHLIRLADQNLYVGKQAGRNQVVR